MAKLYYGYGEMVKGDQFIRYVEREKNKSNKVKKLLSDIRGNKQYYKNRYINNPVELSLVLKPAK